MAGIDYTTYSRGKGKKPREVSSAEVKLRKARDMYFMEKDGAKVKSVSARLPAYAGTSLQAKHGGRIEEHEQQPADTHESN